MGDIGAALEFYGRIFEVKLRGRSGRMAFADFGDQFLALGEGRSQEPDTHRHFGLVVDDASAALAAAREAGARASGNSSSTRGATIPFGEGRALPGGNLTPG